MPSTDRIQPDMHQVLERNIRTLVEQRRREDAERPQQDKAAERISDFVGSMTFVYVHLAILALWVGGNIGIVPGIRPWDPTFVMLAMAASVEAIFLSTFVLITQNRMAAQGERRAELDLQISLLNEHETTRLIEMVAALAERMNQSTPADGELPQLRQNVDPTDVLEKIERASESQ